MRHRTRWIAAAGLAAAMAGGLVAAAAGHQRGQRPGADRSDPRPGGRGRPAATAGGTVLETEAGDDGAAYGVEVRLDDGRQVEVNLDESFKVVNQEPDEDRPNEGADR